MIIKFIEFLISNLLKYFFWMICKSPYQTKQYSHKLGQKPKVDVNFTSKDKVLNPENLQSSSGFSLPSVSFPSISALSNDRAYKEQIISPQSNS